MHFYVLVFSRFTRVQVYRTSCLLKCLSLCLTQVKSRVHRLILMPSSSVAMLKLCINMTVWEVVGYHYVYLKIPLHTYIYLYIPTYTSTYLHIPLHTYIYLYIPTCTSTYLHIPLHTYIYLYIPTYTSAYLHIPLHTYIYLYIPTCTFVLYPLYCSCMWMTELSCKEGSITRPETA